MKSKIIFELPPGENNLRNSEGDFCALANGDVLFAYSRYRSGFADGDKSDIYGIVSHDNGENFSEPCLILEAEQLGADNVMSVSFLELKNGNVGMFFMVKKGDSCGPYFTFSADNGKTWDTPKPCFDFEDYYIMNNNRVIYSNDVIVLPISHHKWCYKEEDGVRKRNGITPGRLCVVASFDDGKTFEMLAEDIEIPASDNVVTGVQEPGITVLPDNTLWCYIRNSSQRQYECFSADNGKTWTTPEPSKFICHPWSPLSAGKLSNGKVIAVWNNEPESETEINGFWTGGRNPLVMAISEDGKNFSKPITIENDKTRGFAYTAIHELNDKSILLAYCAGGDKGDKDMLCRIRIRKIKL